MTNTAISRRAAILGTLASTAAFAVPVTAAQASELTTAMDAHRAAAEALDPLYAALGEAENRLGAMGMLTAPQVKIGRLLAGGREADGSPSSTPIMARTHEQITAAFEHRAAFIRPWASVPYHKKSLAALQATFDGFHAELDRLQAAQAQAMAETGYTVAREALEAAQEAERKLAALVVLARPVSHEEAETKRSYLSEHLFADWDIMTEVLAACVEV